MTVRRQRLRLRGLVTPLVTILFTLRFPTLAFADMGHMPGVPSDLEILGTYGVIALLISTASFLALRRMARHSRTRPRPQLPVRR